MVKETQILKVESTKGNAVEVDISDQACSQFAIKDNNGNNVPARHGIRINDSYYGKGTIIGVAPAKYGRELAPALWISYDCDKNGTVSPWSSTDHMEIM